MKVSLINKCSGSHMQAMFSRNVLKMYQREAIIPQKYSYEKGSLCPYFFEYCVPVSGKSLFHFFRIIPTFVALTGTDPKCR